MNAPSGHGTSGTSGTSAPGVLGLPSNKEFFLWGISALTLIALADPYPNVAIFFAWLLIVGVLVIHGSDYAALIKSAIGG